MASDEHLPSESDRPIVRLPATPSERPVRSGTFVVSLDFELMWGMRDKRSIADYGANIIGVRRAVPAMLDLFAEHDIACTWATVGLLFFANKDEVLQALPKRLPQYADENLSPYADIAAMGADEWSDPYHYGLSMLRQIMSHQRQEIGTHTFSHFYCLEEGGDVDAFRADLGAAQAAAARLGLRLSSIVLPRNQLSDVHLGVCRELGFRAFRGNERVWFHRPRREAEQSLLARGFRLADSFLPIGGAHDHEPIIVDGMVDVPASRFLRPTRGADPLRQLRLRRITSAMATAARHGTLFHLWWHPHNFGADLPANLAFLRSILDYFRTLQDRYGMRSMTMAAVADEVLDVRGQTGAAHL
jgi:hypothetical protein